MNEKTSKVIAICSTCNNPYYCGENCGYCSKNSIDDLKIAKYAAAMKEAVECWQNGDCNEHNVVCKPKVKEFAIKIFELQQKIKLFETAINDHKLNTKVPDENDYKLWGCL